MPSPDPVLTAHGDPDWVPAGLITMSAIDTSRRSARREAVRACLVRPARGGGACPRSGVSAYAASLAGPLRRAAYAGAKVPEAHVAGLRRSCTGARLALVMRVNVSSPERTWVTTRPDSPARAVRPATVEVVHGIGERVHFDDEVQVLNVDAVLALPGIAGMAAGIAVISHRLGRLAISPVTVTAHRFHLTYLLAPALLLLGPDPGPRSFSGGRIAFIAVLAVLGVALPLFVLQIGMQRTAPLGGRPARLRCTGSHLPDGGLRRQLGI